MLKKSSSFVLVSLRGSMVNQRLNGKEETDQWNLSVHQDLSAGWTDHTKCGIYLLASSLPAGLHAERRVLARRGGRVRSVAILNILQVIRTGART